MRMRSRTIAALVLPIALMVGCGDDSESKGGGDAPASRTAAGTIEAYFGALGDEDYPGACALMSKDYLDEVVGEWNSQVAEEDGVASCEEALERGAEVAKAFAAFDDEIDTDGIWEHEVVDVEEDGDSATVVLMFPWFGEGETTYELVKVDGEWLIAGDVEGGSAQADGDDSEDTVIEVTLDEEFTIGDWTIRITDLDLDADEELAAADENNEQPEHQYFMFTFDATYEGSEEVGDIGTVVWSFTDADKTVRDAVWLIQTPGEKEKWPTQVAPGGSLKRQAVFDVDPDLVSGGILRASTVDDDFRSHVADIQF